MIYNSRTFIIDLKSATKRVLATRVVLKVLTLIFIERELDRVLEEIRIAKTQHNLSFVLISHCKQGANSFEPHSTSQTGLVERWADAIYSCKAVGDVNEKFNVCLLKILVRKNRGLRTFFSYWIVDPKDGTWRCYHKNTLQDLAPCWCWKGEKKI